MWLANLAAGIVPAAISATAPRTCSAVEGLDGGLDDSLDVVRTGHVGGQASTVWADFGRDFVQFSLIEVGDEDFCALLDEPQSDCLANRAGGAGDQRDGIVEFHVHFLRLLRH